MSEETLESRAVVEPQVGRTQTDGAQANDVPNGHVPHDDDRNDLPEDLVERLFARISEVSTLPDVALQIIELVSDPDCDAEDLLEAVRGDPTLAMRLMRTVNSAYYGLSGKVADLKQAVTLLGFQEVRNLALTAYVADMFRKETGYRSYSRRGLWNHMVATGMTGQLLAEISGAVPPQEAYLAGLLHDIGLVLLDQYLHGPFCRVVGALTEDVPPWRVEWRILGFDHASLGAYVASRWNLPDVLIAAAGYHHKPKQYEGAHRKMVDIVSLADFFCNLKNVTALGIRHEQASPTDLFLELGLESERVASILERLDKTLAAANLMASVQVR